MIVRNLKLFAFVLVLGLSAQPASADTLLMENIAKNSSVQRPQRGESMGSVKRRYGMAKDVKGAVGDPPITRWKYPEFTVYFEGTHVIHSVVN